MVEREGADAVLVPAINSASSACCIRSLGKRGVRTIAASETETPPAFWSRYVDETASLPSYEDDLVAYKDALLSLASRDDVRTITPLREIDAYVLSKYREEFAAHLEPVWPTMSTLRTAQDWNRLADAATAAGVDAPKTQLLGDVEDWDRPQILKGRYALLASEYVDSYDESTYRSAGRVTYLPPGEEPDRDRILEAMGHEPIVQEYVPGGEYALWALYDHGDPVATCLKRQIRAYQYEGGTSVYRETVDAPALEAVGRRLLDHLDWHGPASVQFKRDPETDAFSLLEINPRFWVSLSCAVRAGLDFPYLYWQLATGEDVTAVDEAAVGYATHLLRGELVHLHSVLRGNNPYVTPPPFLGRTRTVAESMYRQPHFDYLTLDDPGPFVRDSLITLSTLGESLPVVGDVLKRR